ncbi:MAG: DNA-binding protein [Gammaproteobacteria bacterium]|nr:DNA-binding protein [Gammaproteobacteria bacterium]|tara:strand:+ start:492 stop:908 length:417 start_codon:yes stop_codon:yes gene_type:complete
MAKPSRPLPQPTPETQHFWDGTRDRELRLQRCNDCAHVYFPPRPFCPACSSRAVSVFAASGQATLASYVINQRPHPAWDEPYAIAIVELAEGPRMLSNITHCEQTPEALILDMPLEVDFVKMSEEITLPLFKPTGETR